MPQRIFVAQDDDPNTNQHKCKQRPNVCQIDHLINAHHRRKATDDNAGQNRSDVWRLESRMHLGENGRQQAIARDRKEDARLAQLKDEQHSRVGNHRSEGDDCAGPSRVRRDVIERHRQRLGLFSRQSPHQFVVRNETGKDRSHYDIKEGADDQ